LVKRRGTAVLALALVPVTGGCNLVLSIDEHEAIPPNCGVDALEGAQVGFADVREGHCYSVVEHSEPANRDFAGNDCITAGGYLACINDVAEFDIINQNVVSTAWLGMRFDNNGTPECDSGETFDPNLPIWRDGAPSNSGCSIIEGATVSSTGCGDALEHWICEFEPETEE
jgi:hypothetical protein